MSLKSGQNGTLPGKYNWKQRRKTTQDMLGKTNTKKVVLKRTVVEITHDLVPRRTVVTLEEEFVLKRTVHEEQAEEFVLKRTVDEHKKTSHSKKRYPNGQGYNRVI